MPVEHTEIAAWRPSRATIEEVDRLVAAAQARGRAPSVVVAITRDGEVAHVAAAGETPRPHRNVQYRIGSITKTFTAALLLGLRDEGRLGLDDAIGAHLPDAHGTIADLRLRHLLSHTGGLRREPSGDWWERSPGRPLAAGELTAEALGATYGRYHYSNLAYGLLGAVAAQVTGLTWWEAVRQRLLAPLGLTRTTYRPQEPFTHGYVVHPWHGTLREEPIHDSAGMAAAGQMWSTVTDLCRWAAVLATPATRQPTAGADRPALRPATVAEMAAPAVIADPDAWTTGYGLGLCLWRRGERVFAGHTGSMPGYLALLAVHRPSQTGVIAFANTYALPGVGLAALGMSILEKVLDAEPAAAPRAWRPAAMPPAEIANLCGRWWWMGQEYEARWDAEPAELVFAPTAPGAEPSRFRRREADTWLGVAGPNEGEILRVHREGGDGVSALEIATLVFSRDPWPEG